MTRHRDFDAEGFTLDPDKYPEEGPRFTLGGQEFRCLPTIPAGVLEDLPADITLSAACRFIRGVLVPEDEEKFNRVMRSKAQIVGISKVLPILDWLIDVDGAGFSPFAPGSSTPFENGHGPTPPTSGASAEPEVSASTT